MNDSGTRLIGSELLLVLDRSSRTPLRTQLEQRLRALVQTGALGADTLLPSSRTLARDLGVSRRLVLEAYAQLTAEGYLCTLERSGTRVANVAAATTAATPPQPRPASFDLRPGVPALSEFPRAAWVKATAAALKQTPDAALAYPDPRGSLALRTVLAEYLRRVRAVAADPQRVLICSGFTQAISLLTRALGAPAIALEDPGLIGRDRTIATAGGSPVPVPVDDHGLRTDLLARANVDAIIVAPAHQFPLGVTLAPARRASLLAWAQAGRLVIEDDYDAEFRYDRQPVGALQGLAPEHVAYVGTTSKTLAPALRLGWIVLPQTLIEAVTEVKRDQDAGSPTIDQLALATMIRSGVYERHLRRLRRHYRQRRDRLLEALHRHLPTAEIAGTAAGLHLMLNLPGAVDATDVVAAARERDLAVAPLERYTLADVDTTKPRLVVGYGNIAAPAINAAVERLALAIADVRRHSRRDRR